MELVPFCTFSGRIAEPFTLPNAPGGTRLIFDVLEGTIAGERINAALKGRSNADWFTIGADGTGTLDVRLLVETEDGALVFVQYHGRVDTTIPLAPIYATPRFETGDPRYHWLNRIQAVAKGQVNGDTLTYEVCEVR